MKKITITVGIPAFNEQQNIGKLLNTIYQQKINGAVIENIIVISDASTDGTSEVIKSFKHRKIQLINNTKRIGKPGSLNKIINNTTSDILVILDADVLLTEKTFFNNIIEPLTSESQVGLVGADTVAINRTEFIEKTISDSHVFKNEVYKRIRHGNNIYLCHGRCRAFSKAFYSKLKFPSDCSQEDAYSYLECIKKGFKFVYEPSAKVTFISPTTIVDHARQSARFSQGSKNLNKYFTDNMLKKEYELPKNLLILGLIKFIFSKPISAISYILIQIYVTFLSPVKNADNSRWQVSRSTKLHNYENT